MFCVNYKKVSFEAFTLALGCHKDSTTTQISIFVMLFWVSGELKTTSSFETWKLFFFTIVMIPLPISRWETQGNSESINSGNTNYISSHNTKSSQDLTLAQAKNTQGLQRPHTPWTGSIWSSSLNGLAYQSAQTLRTGRSIFSPANCHVYKGEYELAMFWT